MERQAKRETRADLDRRAEQLAELHGLSLQLTTIWVGEHPEESRRPMLPKHLDALKRWATVSA